MKSPSPNCKTSDHHKSGKQSSITKHTHFKSSQKKKLKAGKLQSQPEDLISQTSSSSFVCETVKESRKIHNNLKKDNELCNLSLPKKSSFPKKNSKEHVFIDKRTFDSKPKSKATLVNDSRLLFEDTALPEKTVTLTKHSRKLQHLQKANPKFKNVPAKPAIIKMKKESNTGIHKPNSDLNKSFEKVLGLGSPVQSLNHVQKSNESNEKIDFLLNIIKSPTLKGSNVTGSTQPNISKKQHRTKPKNTSKTIGHNSLQNGEIEVKTKPQQAKGHSVNMADFIQFGSMDKKSITKIYKLTSSKFLFVMKPESSFYLVGVTEVQLLSGYIEILGYDMDKSKQRQTIFSLQGSSHLYVRASKQTFGSTTNDEQFNGNIITNVLSSHDIDSDISRKILEDAKSNTIFTLTRVKNHKSATVWPHFFECHSSFPLFPFNDVLNNTTRAHHSVEYGLDCILDENLQALGLKEFHTNPVWPETANGIVAQDQPRTVICGGKSVGKSSLLRYLVNKSLSKWDKVIVIDFDVGQCEFTLPGCISVTLVDKPLLGPNYTHLAEPLRSVFLGEVDVTKCPEPYIDGCKLLIDFAQQHYNHLPWFINTMGFTRGFGITVTCGIISDVNPTHVLQIESKDRKLNFPSTLEPRFVYSQNISSFNRQNSGLNYRLHVLQSGSEQSANRHTSQNSRGMSPLEARNLVILSYLSEMLDTEISNLSQVTPHMVNIGDLSLLTTSQCNLTKDQVAMSMNGNLVALCCPSEENNFPNCIGFGIVRAIDWQTNVMYIITPMPASSLQRVNCVIKGSVSLPESLYLYQGEQVVGHVPYTALTSSQATSRFAKRDFRSLPTTPRSAARN